MKTGSLRCQPAWECKCKPKYLAELQQWCQTPCSLNALWHFILWLPAQFQIQESTVMSGHSAVCESLRVSERLVERHKPSLNADNHLAYNVLQKTSSTRKVFCFCQSFQSGTDPLNRAQMAPEQWLKCKTPIEASGTFPSLSNSSESSFSWFFFFFFWRHLKCMTNIRKWKLQRRKLRLQKSRMKGIKTNSLSIHLYVFKHAVVSHWQFSSLKFILAMFRSWGKKSLDTQ